MPTLTLYFHSQPVGLALVDPSLADLPTSLKWSVSLPASLTRRNKGRPDIIAALLNEDPQALKRCHPHTQLYYQGRSLTLRLSRIALRPELIPLIQTLIFNTKDNLSEISSITAPIRRVIFVNSNRCDCRSENLREIGQFQRIPEDLDDVSNPGFQHPLEDQPS